MIINATLLIQMIHFFIAYLILRFFVFKPAIRAIEKDDSFLRALKNQVIHQQESLEAKQKEKMIQWANAKEYFSSQVPLVSRKPDRLKGLHYLMEAKINKKELFVHLEPITKEICTKVTHVA